MALSDRNTVQVQLRMDKKGLMPRESMIILYLYRILQSKPLNPPPVASIMPEQ